MRRFGYLACTASLAIVMPAIPAHADAAGTAFTYQGRLMDGGLPANGPFDLWFRLYASEAATIVLGNPVLLDNVQVTNGLFSAPLNFGSEFPGAERWLAISVRPGASTGSYTLLSPRQELTPTPYAITAENLAIPFYGAGDTDPPQPEFTPTGLFKVAQFGNANAIVGQSAGEGASVYGYSTGEAPAIYGRATGPGLDAVGVQGTSSNFRAAEFIIENAANPFQAMHAETTGSGFAVSGWNRGTGTAVVGTASGPTGNGGRFVINNAQNNSAALHCETNGGGPALYVNGRAVCEVLEITGADVAEKFPVSESVQPGMVLAIDRDNPGKLCLASGAYNKRVAGVVSGANGLPAGTILGNLPGNEAAPPVALSGRVWVFCDASEKAIEPGDLMTTAERAGHAMSVVDGSRAPGATIGKAMAALPKGETGMVLVLVNLQ